MKLVYGPGIRAGQDFSTGWCSIDYKSITRGDLTSRVVVPVFISGVKREAFLDTGAPYLIVPPDDAIVLGLRPESDDRVEALQIRGTSFRGHLIRREVQLLSTDGDGGENVEFDATMFIPDVDQNRPWQLPLTIGLFNCLDRVSFAVDAQCTTFRFGPENSG